LRGIWTSNSPSKVSISNAVNLDPESELKLETFEDEEEEEQELEKEDYFFKINIHFTETYPETAPEFNIETVHLSDTQIEQLEADIKTEIESLLGMAMVYSIVSFAKDRAEQILLDEIKDNQIRLELEKERQEKEEQQKFEGSRVTKESFLDWQKGFLEEAKLAKNKGLPLSLAFQSVLAVENLMNSNAKLTGKQLFEKDLNLLKSDEGYEEGVAVELDTANLHGIATLSLEDNEDSKLVLSNFTEDE
jgi:hypothetical protein